MEIISLVITSALLLIVIFLLLKNKSNNDIPQLQTKLSELQTNLLKIETNLKDDFRINREENSNVSKDNRTELNNTLKDFKNELSITLKNITDNSQNALSEINSTLSNKIELLVTKIDENNKANREALTSNLKDFTTEQRIKFDEIKKEQNDLTNKTVEQLEKVINTIEDKLKVIKLELSETLRYITENNQNALREINSTLSNKIELLVTKIDENNKANREALTSNLKDFTTEQRPKFDEIKKEQNDLTNKTVEQLEKITSKVEDKLKSLNEQNKTDNGLMREALINAFKGFQDTFDKNIISFNELQKEKFGQLEIKQNELVKNTETKLESIRVTVEEKLEKTLSERLGQSFETVGKQLIEVQKGLGEMQTLAQDVGGLKKVLSNVKMRGGIGEVQLAMLLEQVLAPEQYEANVKTKKGRSDLVEFAIKLPGRDDGNSVVWLPVDAKFPKDVYEQLQTAYDLGDLPQIEQAQKNLEATIKKMAKDIHDKYIDPPNTTDFGIMFLPFEGIYAEVVRKASLLEELQRNYKIIVTGPTTLAAILNSLQMGFKTLAIQKRSGEVWKVLGAVKKEFETFGGLLDKAHKNLNIANDSIESLMGTRTRAIQRTLRGVETLSQAETNLILPEIDEENNKIDEN